MRRLHLLACSTLLTAQFGCSSASVPPGHPAAPAAARFVQPTFIHPSRILPNPNANAVVLGVEPDGSQRRLLAQMRVLVHPDGSLERAPGLVPGSSRTSFSALELPARMNGGLLLVASSETSTMLWAADSWLAPAKPLSTLNLPVSGIEIGFDRLYAHHKRHRSFMAIDPATGGFTTLGALPIPARFGVSIFADAWRAVIVTDLLGPMASFNAGETWTPIPIPSSIAALGIRDNAIVLNAGGQSYSLDSSGALSPLDKQTTSNLLKTPPPLPASPPPLSDHPAIAAITQGIPISPSLAAVAANGSVFVVEAASGRILRTVVNAYPTSYSYCHGIPLGSGVGFICGQPNGPTTIFSLTSQVTLTPVLSWPSPNLVTSSGNGSVVAHAPCPAAAPTAGQSSYCVRSRDGSLHDVRFQGDLGAERVVGLSDGRIAAIIVPRFGDPGSIMTIDKSQRSLRPLSYASMSKEMASLVKKSLYLQGAFEIAPGKIGIWTDIGNATVPVRIGLDGTVQAGQVLRSPWVVMPSGRFAVAWNGSHAKESVDGGMTYREIDMPSASSLASSGTMAQGCSAVGCLFGPFIRSGWGQESNPLDSKPMETPRTIFPPYVAPHPIALDCYATGRISPPALPIPAPRSVAQTGTAASHRPQPSQRGFLPFGPMPPPPLRSDQEGFGFGREYAEPRFRGYVWGPISGDWSHRASWTLRYDDAFSAMASPRSTLATAVPWPDITTASAALNTSATSLLSDPSSNHAVLQLCGGTRQCTLYAASDGRSLQKLSNNETSTFPQMSSFVQAGEALYLLEKTHTHATVWTSDSSGIMRKLVSLPRVPMDQADPLILSRMLRGNQIALLTMSALYGASSQQWTALPIEAGRAEPSSAQALVHSDLQDASTSACTPNDNGWLLETTLPIPPTLRNAEGSVFGTSVRVRMVLGTQTACISALSARANPVELGRPSPVPARATIPLSAWDQSTSRKSEVFCATR